MLFVYNQSRSIIKGMKNSTDFYKRIILYIISVCTACLLNNFKGIFCLKLRDHIRIVSMIENRFAYIIATIFYSVILLNPTDVIADLLMFNEICDINIATYVFGVAALFLLKFNEIYMRACVCYSCGYIYIYIYIYI